MSIVDTIKSMLGGKGGPQDPNILWLYVRCKRCGTPLAVRVDLRNDPSHDYDSGGYVLRKEMMDAKCFSLMTAEIHFDPQKKIIAREIDRGEFITREEYEKIQVPSPRDIAGTWLARGEDKTN